MSITLHTELEAFEHRLIEKQVSDRVCSMLYHVTTCSWGYCMFGYVCICWDQDRCNGPQSVYKIILGMYNYDLDQGCVGKARGDLTLHLHPARI